MGKAAVIEWAGWRLGPPGRWGPLFPSRSGSRGTVPWAAGLFFTACCYSYPMFPVGVKQSINSGLAWAPFPLWFLWTRSGERSGREQPFFLCSDPVSSPCTGGCAWGALSVPARGSLTRGTLRSQLWSLCNPLELPGSLSASTAEGVGVVVFNLGEAPRSQGEGLLIPSSAWLWLHDPRQLLSSLCTSVSSLIT